VAQLELQVLGLIGRGSFASVFRAIWRGRCVALKVVQLPACAAGDGDDDLSFALQTREHMAVMEAVISATMSHPNVVQVRM
jgi:serine/threonine protein kinase